jgi:peptidoglycan/LPS O-acetylase OafA/YrhL
VPSSPAERVLGLDLLRALAVTAVAGAHGLPALYPHIPYLWFLGGGGFVGVELFFVLSGFLIGGILIRSGERGELAEPRGLGIFYVRRWLRTLPVFWVFLAINVLIMSRYHGVSLSWAEIAGHGFFIKNFHRIQLSFMPESWSLAVEEWFYLLFPAVLWLGLRLSKRFDLVFLATAALFLGFSTWLRHAHALAEPTSHWAQVQRCVVIYRFDALMFGILAAWLWRRSREALQRVRLPALAFGILLFLGLYFTQWTYGASFEERNAADYFSQTHRFTLLSLAFALMLPAAASYSAQREGPCVRAIRAVALWSYVMYLLHGPWYAFVDHWGLAPATRSLPQGLLIFSLKFGGALLCSGVVFWLLERPVMKFRERVTRLMEPHPAAPAC